MTVGCLVRTFDGRCYTPGSEPDEQFVIRQSVGAGGANSAIDVRQIQTALNGVPPDAGGPQPPLVVDGICGTLTRGAILTFQRGRLTRPDGLISPRGPTLAALNGETSASPTVAVLSTNAVGAGTPGKQAADPATVAQVAMLLPKVRTIIRAAQFHCTAAAPFCPTRPVRKGDQPPPEPARGSLRKLHAVFGLLAHPTPDRALDVIARVYRNMDVALNRSFETDPLIAPILFVPNEYVAMEKRAAAYTSEKGAFRPPTEKFSFPPIAANRIYICKNFLTYGEDFQLSGIVHELAHYVSGQPVLIGDQIKSGTMLEPSQRPAFDKLQPFQKIRSAEHYGFFAYAVGYDRIQ